MKLVRWSSGAVVVFVLFAAAFIGKETQPVGAQMADAANVLLGTLTAEQKAKAVFPFDSPERTKWAFVPKQDEQKRPTRKGLRLEEMTKEQQEAVMKLLRSGTSDGGYKQAVAIMSLEALLAELEGEKGRMVRNTGWYFTSIYGTPGAKGKWGWRIEGHHFAVNFTIADGQVLSATPAFFGANPAEIKAGANQGKRTLPEVEDNARALFASLTSDQKKVAHQTKHFAEIQEIPAAKVGPPVGLAAAEMKAEQRQLLEKLIVSYAERMPAEIAKAQLKVVTDGGFDKVHFAYSGGTKSGEEYTYRVQGPAFVIEFLNVQADSAGNKANHIHSVWRELPSDFGLAAR